MPVHHLSRHLTVPTSTQSALQEAREDYPGVELPTWAHTSPKGGCGAQGTEGAGATGNGLQSGRLICHPPLLPIAKVAADNAICGVVSRPSSRRLFSQKTLHLSPDGVFLPLQSNRFRVEQ